MGSFIDPNDDGPLAVWGSLAVIVIIIGVVAGLPGEFSPVLMVSLGVSLGLGREGFLRWVLPPLRTWWRARRIGSKRDRS